LLTSFLTGLLTSASKPRRETVKNRTRRSPRRALLFPLPAVPPCSAGPALALACARRRVLPRFAAFRLRAFYTRPPIFDQAFTPIGITLQPS
jgi:hypothetical protein